MFSTLAIFTIVFFIVITEIAYFLFTLDAGDNNNWVISKFLSLFTSSFFTLFIIGIPYVLEQEHPGTWFYPIIFYVVTILFFGGNYFFGEYIVNKWGK